MSLVESDIDQHLAKRIKTEKTDILSDEEDVLNKNCLDENLTIKVNEKRMSTQNLNDKIVEDENDENLKDTSLENELNFKLEWSLMERLVLNLNQFTSLLYSRTKSINSDELIKENHNLVNNLMNLKLVYKDDLYKDNLNEHITKKDELMLELNWSIRAKLLDSLILNHSSLINKGILNKEAKSNLIDKNKSLVEILINLPILEENEENNETISYKDAGPASKHSETFHDYSEPSNEFDLNDKKPVKTNLEMVNKEKLEERIEKLINEVDKIKRLINDRPGGEITFTFKISNLKDFFSKTNSTRSSEMFYVRNLPWLIEVRFIKERCGQVTAYLYNCYYESRKWSIKCRFEFRVISNLNYVFDVVNKFNFNFTNDLRSHGSPDLIDLQKLYSLRKGYVSDDSFYVRLNLVADKPIFYD